MAGAFLLLSILTTCSITGIFLSILTTCSIAGILHPEQIHLSFSDTDNEMTVMWSTSLNLSSKLAYRPYSCNSSGVKSQWIHVKGTAKKFYPGRLGLRFYYWHEAQMNGLSRECLYEYKLGNGYFWSATHKLSGRTTQHSAPFEDNEPVAVWIYGD